MTLRPEDQAIVDDLRKYYPQSVLICDTIAALQRLAQATRAELAGQKKIKEALVRENDRFRCELAAAAEREEKDSRAKWNLCLERDAAAEWEAHVRAELAQARAELAQARAYAERLVKTTWEQEDFSLKVQAERDKVLHELAALRAKLKEPTEAMIEAALSAGARDRRDSIDWKLTRAALIAGNAEALK